MIPYIIKKLQDPTNRPHSKYYARPAHEGTVKLETIEREISSQSTLSRADIKAAIIALVDNIGDHLLEGESVKIDEFGTFFLRMQSSGKETQNEVSYSDFKEINVGFKPAPEFKKRLKKEATFRKKKI